jgi:glucokinase
VAEIGHLRPGMTADLPDHTIESLASGPGIAAAALARVSGDVARPLETLRAAGGADESLDVRQRLASAHEREREFARDLLARALCRPERLTAKIVAQAAEEGNTLAQEVLSQALQALGWGIATVITLVAPEVVVVGGGVSLAGEAIFLGPLRKEVDRYVFPPLLGSYQVLPSALGETVVVHGALAIARDSGP